MTHYFASDVHLRVDDPHRNECFAQFVAALGSDDTLVIAGDLCDFWFATRQIGKTSATCSALAAVREFRERGGELTVLVGNHDLWLGPYYEAELQARILQEPYTLLVAGLRIHVVHGHRTTNRWGWKRLLETRLFWHLFRALPDFVATRLEQALMSEKTRGVRRRNDRFMSQFRQYVAKHSQEADLFVFGHVHQRADEHLRSGRLVVLGDWSRQAQYLAVNGETISPVGTPLPNDR